MVEQTKMAFPRSLSILCFVDVLVCVAGFSYSTAEYFSKTALSVMSASMSPVVAGKAVVTAKIGEMPAKDKNRDLILNEFKARNREYMSLYDVLAASIANSKIHALIELLLWLAVGAICTVVLGRLEVIRRRNGAPHAPHPD